MCRFYLSLLKALLTKFLVSYRKKNLRKKTVEFIEAMRRSMGVHCVVLEGYKAFNDGAGHATFKTL